MTLKEKQKVNRLPDLFVGPLGRAQLSAIKFADGLSRVDSIMLLVEKMEKINKMIEETEMTPMEIDLANTLLEELAYTFIELSGGSYASSAEEEVH